MALLWGHPTIKATFKPQLMERNTYYTVWLGCTSIGVWPENLIDHRNYDQTDNRFKNLREATHSQNHRNVPAPKHNTSGYKNITWNKIAKRWNVTMRVDGKLKYIGGSKDLNKAIQIRNEAYKTYCGEFTFKGE